jgi:hypothetical protein
LPICLFASAAQQVAEACDQSHWDPRGNADAQNALELSRVERRGVVRKTAASPTNRAMLLAAPCRATKRKGQSEHGDPARRATSLKVISL